MRQAYLAVTHRRPAISDWEAAYSNRKAVADVDEWLAGATQKSAAFLEGFAGEKQLGRPYGDGSRKYFDVLSPEVPLGTLVFIHGGYWRATSTADHYHFAAGALQRGWRVVLPEYPLCPSVTIPEIAANIVRALEVLGEEFPEGDLVLSGHSAGGHLATFAASTGSALSGAVRRRVKRVISISGLHDLRPLIGATDLNRDLRLTDEDASRLSPALSRPGHDFELLCVCGGGELPEFQRQNDLLPNIWGGFGIPTLAAMIGDLNHFQILDLLTEAGQPLTGLLTDGAWKSLDGQE